MAASQNNSLQALTAQRARERPSVRTLGEGEERLEVALSFLGGKSAGRQPTVALISRKNNRPFHASQKIVLTAFTFTERNRKKACNHVSRKVGFRQKKYTTSTTQEKLYKHLKKNTTFNFI